MTEAMNKPFIKNVYSLTELAAEIKEVIHSHLRRPVWIKAEISELKAGQRGHYYLQLADKQYGIIESQMRANIWAGVANHIIPSFEGSTGIKLSKGLTILFHGTVQYHKIYGLSVSIQYIDPQYTLGEMAREKEVVIERLRKEGFWDMNRELVVPTVPQRLAVIAAPGSKGLNDFNKTLKTFCPHISFSITLFSSIMQGENAAADIIRNLRIIEDQHMDFDTIIMIRGGGAELDLKCFDEYKLCAIMAQVSLPVITGIGHTDDETICDLIASVRRKTPTDTAMFICELVNDFQERVNIAEEVILRNAGVMLQDSEKEISDLEKRIHRAVKNEIRFQNNLIHNMADKVSADSGIIIREEEKKLLYKTDELKQRSEKIIANQSSNLERMLAVITNKKDIVIQTERIRVETLNKMIRILHPENILRRGYSITTLKGKALINTEVLTPGDEIETILFKGAFTSIITKKENK